jgi:hypothetical protein
MATSDLRVKPKPFDLFAALAFGLSVFIMILPFEADILFGLFITRRYALAFLVAVCCSAAVLAPFLVSLKRQWRQPERWRGRGYLIATAVVLTINSLMFGFAFVSLFFQ